MFVITKTQIEGTGRQSDVQ